MTTDDDDWARHERELAKQSMACRLPGSMDQRRKPRVRLREGRKGLFLVLGSRKTKRAAFRAARELRDAGGERRPQVVWQESEHQWNFGVRADSVPSNGGHHK